MRVDHRGTDVTVTEELLDGPDVVVVLVALDWLTMPAS
jgi:hypothetical protein